MNHPQEYDKWETSSTTLKLILNDWPIHSGGMQTATYIMKEMIFFNQIELNHKLKLCKHNVNNPRLFGDVSTLRMSPSCSAKCKNYENIKDNTRDRMWWCEKQGKTLQKQVKEEKSRGQSKKKY